mmetsp:Transcript_46431/g.148952  ORF Transcript_46431/g.148952 Transcript_46431/m.148952 type:complete len:243 (-) Transcript_46431:153-881(-)
MHLSRKYYRMISFLKFLVYTTLSIPIKSLSCNISSFNTALDDVIRAQAQFLIVQVGANDGISHGDIVYPAIKKYKHVEAVLFEPQDEMMKELKKNYEFAIQRVHLVDRAITNRAGIVTLHVPHKDCDNKGLASLNMHHVKDRKGLCGKQYFRAITVPTTTMSEQLHRIGLSPGSNYGLLQIDAEGMDDKIIRWSSIQEFRPQLIRFESKTFTPKKIIALKKYLKPFGYSTFTREGPDTWTCQ